MSFTLGLLGKCGEEFTIPTVVIPELQPVLQETFYSTFNCDKDDIREDMLFLHLDTDQINDGTDFSKYPNYIKQWHPKAFAISELKKMIAEMSEIYKREKRVLEQLIEIIQSDKFTTSDKVAFMDIYF